MVGPSPPGNQAHCDPGTASTTRSQHGGTRLGPVQSTDGIGAYIRAWRQRLRPADAGLPVGTRRRTSGLRREELASLAGISVDYLVRLEQGRAANPSAQVLAALARALRLESAERDHLYTIAGHAPPRRTTLPSHVPPSVQRLVDRLGDVPVAVYNPAWTIISWNPTWAALMGDPSASTGRDRNLLWRTFTGSTTRVRQRDRDVDEFETSAVADLRRVADTYPDDPELRRLLDDLRQASPRFAALWEKRVVTLASGPSAKTIEHPEVGPITLDCDVLTVAGTDLRLVVYTAAPGSPNADKLDLLRVVGLQELSAD